MRIPEGKKVYFLSDFHLGSPDPVNSLEREKRVVLFLDKIKKDASVVFLLGDVFDFWFEYRKVVPKGHVRLLGKFAELHDLGIQLHYFVGNHDMWIKDYFTSEMGIQLHYHEKEFQFNGKSFLIGHGDGLGPGDYSYKVLKKIFRSPLCQYLFGLLPPYFGISIADHFSKRSRVASASKDQHFLGEEKEWLIIYCRERLLQQYFDYFIFGHRHLPIDFELGEGSRYVNLGDWIKYDSYAEFDGTVLQLKYN